MLDTLVFYETNTGGYNGPNGIARLFNGATLLGTVNFTAHGGQSFGFVAPGSAFTFGPLGTVNDWTSLIDGTINGILDITFDRTIDVSISLVGLGVGYFSQGFYDASPQPTITGENVLAATPLPATLPLFASGLGAMALLGWCKKRKARVKIA